MILAERAARIAAEAEATDVAPNFHPARSGVRRLVWPVRAG
jgi:hypothetical protein